MAFIRGRGSPPKSSPMPPALTSEFVRRPQPRLSAPRPRSCFSGASEGLMRPRCRADAPRVSDWLEQLQSQQSVPAGALVLGLLIGPVASPLSALVHEYGHAL